MIWKNKTHEFDQYADKLLAMNNWKKYYIFGAGLLGNELSDIFMNYNCEVVFIDNNTAKMGKKINGVNVISLSEYTKKRDGWIVIAASAKNTLAIKKQLEDHLLRHREDFFLLNEFVDYIFPIISVYGFHKSFVGLAQITLTERCTLKCKKCAHGCSYVDNRTATDLTLSQVYKSADVFFKKVDFTKEFVLIGGEPLLYKALTQAVEYIGERYREQMSLFVITTNGTIVPEEDVLKACQRYRVLFRISNYSRQIPKLNNSYQRLVSTLEKYGISYILGEEEHEWMDYGFEYVDRGAAEEKLVKVFDECKTPCREIRENRFYFCVMARSISENLGFHIGQKDYLDMDKLSGEEYRKELLEFTLGYSEKGYLDMCRHCNGSEAENYPIPAAEQVKSDET